MSPLEAKTGVKPIEKIKELQSFGADCYVWEPTPGKLGEHGRKGKWVGWDNDNSSHMIFFPKEGHRPQAFRTSKHVVMKHVKLPEAVLKGEIGLVYPEHTPLAPEDDLEVDIPLDKEVSGTTGEEGGVTVSDITQDQPTRIKTALSETTNLEFENVEHICTNEETTNSEIETTPDPLEDKGGVPTAKSPNADIEAIDISEDEAEFSDDADMLMSGDTDNPPVATLDPIAVDEEKRPDPTQHVMPAPKRSERRNLGRDKRVRFDEVTFPRSTSKRQLPQRARKEVTVGTLGTRRNQTRKEVEVGTLKARHIVNSAQLYSVTINNTPTPKEEFPIGEISFDCRKALKSPKYGSKFRDSIKLEMSAIDKFKVMRPVLRNDIPADTKLFNSYMLCHRKSLGGGEWKCKSRLVVDGSNTIPGVHTAEMDISTSLPRWNAVRILLATAKGKRVHGEGG